jgi:hypothetical protein
MSITLQAQAHGLPFGDERKRVVHHADLRRSC